MLDWLKSLTGGLPRAVSYGLVVFAASFVVGWITGLGGSPLPNFWFSALMGLLAGGLFALAQKYAGNRKE